MKSVRVIIGTLMPVIMVAAAAAMSVEEARSASRWGTRPGVYRPRERTALEGRQRPASAETTAFRVKLKALESLFVSHRLVQQPRGYSVDGTVVVELRDGAAGGGPVLAGRFSLVVRQFRDGPGGAPVETKVAAPSVIVRFNDFERLFGGQRIHTEGHGNDLYYQPRRVGAYKGFPLYNDNDVAVFVSPSSRPLWVPVSVREYIEIKIKRIEADRDAFMKDTKGTRTPRQIVDQGKAERLRSFNEAYAMLKRHSPADAERAKREFEDSERRLAAEAASNPGDPGAMIRETMRHYEEIIAGLRGELAALSPSKQAAQAIYIGERPDLFSGLGSARDENARPVVRINRAYFNDGKPASSLRCITVELDIQGQSNPAQFDWSYVKPDLESTVVYEIMSTMDWKGIASLADR